MPQHWWNFVTQARWFTGRGRNGRISDVHRLPWYTRPGVWPAIRSEVAVVSYPEGDSEYYHLLVGYLDDTDPGRDIAQHPGLLRLLWQAWHVDGPGTLTPYWDTDLPADLPAAPFTGEQSNSSVRFGDTVMVKFFRRLQGNAEVSLLRTLAANDSGRVPRLHGSVSCVVPELGPTDLAMIVENVPAARDGWDAARACAAEGTSFAPAARQLGTDLRSLHAQLATAFPTSSVAGADLVGELAESATRLAADTEPAAAAARLVRAASERTWPAIAVQRIHADLHLGQCLESPRGWVFVDFEGEPLRGEDDRRVEDSVWRDIAGMLRSFDYASHAGPAGDAKAWIGECRDAFLEGYRGSSRLTELGQLYELEKVIYEVAYERKYRPEWASIPLGAVVDIAVDVAAWVAPGQEWKWHTI